MDFVRYAEDAARLANARLAGLDDIAELLGDRAWLAPQLVDRDLMVLRRFTRELRSLFAASGRADESHVVDDLNALLARHPVTPYLTGHDAEPWHLHIATRSSSVADQLIAEALTGLASVVCNRGSLRLGVCLAAGCDDVFVDSSPNQSRRYCSERCSSRANVAAYRARRRTDRQVG